MNKKTIFITGGVILILLGLGFVFKQALGPDFNQAELSFDDPAALAGAGFDSQAGIVQSEELFFQQIQQLQNITFSESQILDDPSFERLNDNTVTLRSVTPGRSNPFEPIDLRRSLKELSSNEVGQTSGIDDSSFETTTEEPPADDSQSESNPEDPDDPNDPEDPDDLEA